jgi:hypothetical protein
MKAEKQKGSIVNYKSFVPFLHSAGGDWCGEIHTKHPASVADPELNPDQ